MEKFTKELINDNRIIFEHYLKIISNIKNPDQKILLLKIIAAFATFRHTGYFSNNELEKQLLEIADKLDFEIPHKEFKKNSFLHVMTQCYDTGGHTRVVERWINNSPEKETHSLVLIAQGNTKIPEWLEKSIKNKDGEIVQLTDKRDIDKAIKLNKIASKFEYIILHIHFWDSVPILAFGTEKFKRPIIFFNHSDHIFWLGISISDIIAELRTSGKNLSLQRRGNTKSELLYIPIEYNNIKYDKFESRKKLNLPIEKKIILSIGGSFKYRPFGKYQFVEFALELIKKCDDTIFIVIGPDKSEKIWKDAYENSNEKLNAIGIIQNESIDDYRASADLYIESFPFGSATALLDTGLIGIPVLSLSTEMESLDIVLESGIQCEDTNQLISRAIYILNKKPHQNLKQNIIKNHCGTGWHKRLAKLVASTPPVHSLNKNFKSDITLNAYDEYLYNLTKYSYSNEYLIDIRDYSKLSFINKIFIFKYTFHIKILNFTLLKKLIMNLIPFHIKFMIQKYLLKKSES